MLFLMPRGCSRLNPYLVVNLFIVVSFFILGVDGFVYLQLSVFFKSIDLIDHLFKMC